MVSKFRPVVRSSSSRVVIHVMFIGLDGQLKDGETRPATLIFEKAGSIDVDFNVETIQKMKSKYVKRTAMATWSTATCSTAT
jgi:hypothetical protein